MIFLFLCSYISVHTYGVSDSFLIPVSSLLFLSQGRPITPVYAVAHNVQRIPAAAAAAGLYGASYVPIAAHTNTAALAALQKNAAVAAAAYGGYAGYMPQTFPAAAFQVPIHDVYQTYWEAPRLLLLRDTVQHLWRLLTDLRINDLLCNI